MTDNYALVAEVPTKGVKTIYSRLGDWFAWVCMLGLACLIYGAARKRHA